MQQFLGSSVAAAAASSCHRTLHCKLLLPLQFKCSAWTMTTGWPCHGQATRRRPVASPAASVLLGKTCPPRRRSGVIRLSSRLAYTYHLPYLAKTRPTPRSLPAAFFLRGTLMAPSPPPPWSGHAAALRIIQTECQDPTGIKNENTKRPPSVTLELVHVCPPFFVVTEPSANGGVNTSIRLRG
jgi:hypothetical protein